MQTATKEQLTKMYASGYIPATEAAKQISCHITTLYRWVDDTSNAIQSTRVGARRYVEVRSLATFLRRNESLAGPSIAMALESYHQGLLAAS